MNVILPWALKLVLGALLLTPFIGGIGLTWIDRWWTRRLEFERKCTLSRANALVSMADRMKNDGKTN